MMIMRHEDIVDIVDDDHETWRKLNYSHGINEEIRLCTWNIST